MVILVMLFSLSGVYNAMGSYASFGTDELIKQSDIILIGDIVGPVSERKDWSQGLNGTWSKYWKVNVYYYLKGDETAQEFIVSTPGAENKMVMTSIDYRLDQWGKTVLLFLKHRESGFEPFSPQGVVSLEKANSNQGPADTIDGKQILKEFTIANPQINDSKVLENYILDNNSIVIPKPGTAGSDSAQSKFNPIFLALAVTIGLALTFFLIIGLLKRHRNK
ncbi:MAG: hypothetical protein ACRKFN_11945 [Desulfitobacterium sp.]